MTPTQPVRAARIGYLATVAPPPRPIPPAHPLGAFLDGLRELGYVEGENLVVEYRWADGEAALRESAAELVRLGVDVIVLPGSAPAALAARQATGAIPIVFIGIVDPVASGLVASFARPGGNVTGLSFTSPELSGKQLQLLTEAFPGIARIAVIWHADNPSLQRAFGETQAAAGALGLQLLPLGVRIADELEAVFDLAAGSRADALFIMAAAIFFAPRAQIAALALRGRLPAMYGQTQLVEAGGLMGYAPSASDLNRRGAAYVDRILKGARPADLPVEQPSTFDFVVNLQTARALGLTIPPSVLQQATELIQ
jgi:putative ABC transport system substrate-binding protein